MSRYYPSPDTATLNSAIAWLRSNIDGLERAPERLHDHVVGDKDATGAPRFSGRFWAILTFSPFAVRDSPDAGSLPAYAHPLSAALDKLRHEPATSKVWPTPFQLVVALMHAGFDVRRAAKLIGHPIKSPDQRATVEAAFLLALRKLHGRYATGPIPRPYTSLSESQRHAEDAA